MTTYDLIAAYTAQRTPIRRTRPGPLTRLIRHMREMRQYDHILHQPDHVLEDIGVTRAEIHDRRRAGWF